MIMARRTKHCDRIVFRKFPEGDVIALFPDQPQGRGLINSYQHLGQHGAANSRLITELKPAKPTEYRDLLQELKVLGYKPCKACCKEQS
jgi:hypothetical protein